MWRRTDEPEPLAPQAPDPAKVLRAVREVGVFSGLPDAERRRLVEALVPIELSAGQRLFESGEPAERAYVLLSGCIHLKQSGAVHVEELAAGDWIGDADLDQPGTHGATAVARTSTLLLGIEPARLSELDDALRAYLSRRLARANIERLRALRGRIEALTGREEILAELLYAQRTQKGVGFAQSSTVKLLFSKVKALPISSMRLLSKMLDERTTKNEIVELVTMDPALTTTLLRAVNTPLFGFRHKTTNVGHAIVLMGHDIVYQIIMSESMRRSLPDTPFFKELHRRAIEVSRIASPVSEVLRAGRPAEVATLGLLCDIGFVVIELLKTNNPGLSILFDDLEPAEMGAELLRAWQLPELLCGSIQYSRYPEFAPPQRVPLEVRANVAALYLARCCYDDLHGIQGASPRIFVAEYLSAIGYPDLTAEGLLRDRVLPKLRVQMRHLPRSLAERVRQFGR
ncbi:HDOD domain-containing protein [Thiorhodococcus minor]|uniref:HDOD domain-containing protein n=1 Tax=Thiorhodococcus minor TaxID=57489 RepID=A0A6M0JWC9_9GAMM|nr:HDOD domain-containing protein [Thiorhodococcus minor]NEV61798.1 HDOD domain-containing protein [Thiorhodococcus minor]